MDSAFGSLPHTICYAMKANSNLGILRVFAALGSGFDIVSGGELYRLRRIGVPGNRIVFSGVGKSREEIREALRARILLFNVESAAELDLLASEASRLARSRRRLHSRQSGRGGGGHPHISTGHHRHKFGIDWDTGARTVSAAPRFALDRLAGNQRAYRFADCDACALSPRADAPGGICARACGARASRFAISIAAAGWAFATRRRSRRR